MGNLSSGIIATEPLLRVTNVMAHGPGIKLLHGLAEASTNGDTTYAYRCRPRFLQHLSSADQSESSLLLRRWHKTALDTPSRRQSCPNQENRWARAVPSFAKEGWLRHQENGPVP